MSRGACRTRWPARASTLSLSLLVVSCTGVDVVLFRIGAGGASVPPDAGGDAAAPAGSGGSAGRHGASGGRTGTGGAKPNGGQGGIGGAASSGGTPSGGASAAGGTPPTMDAGPVTNCVASTDCPPTWTCAKAGCAAASGVCEPRPLLCAGDATPVCGCDHITYWNDCVRLQNSVAGSTPGECAAGATSCLTAVDCHALGATCSHAQASGPSCAPPGLGTCWVTPLDCSTTPQTPKWVLCQPPPMGPVPSPCVDSCTAIRSGLPYVGAPPGTLCP